MFSLRLDNLLKHSMRYLLLGLLAFSFNAFSITLSEPQGSINLAKSTLVLEDPTGQLTFQQILQDENQKRFKKLRIKGDEINFGFSQSSYWIKLSLAVESGVTDAWVLEIPYLGLDQIAFYPMGKPAIITGGDRSVSSRPLFNRYYAFPVILDSKEQSFYLRVSSKSPISIPLELWQADAFSKHVQYSTFLQALYYGGIGVLAIFHFLLFVYLRDRIFLLYSVFAITLGLGIFSGNGYGRLYLWPNQPQWDQISQAVFLGVAGAAAWIFTTAFLNTRKYLPKVNSVLHINSFLLALSSVGLFLSFLFDFSPSVFLKAVPLLSIPGAILTMYAAINVWRLGQDSAKYFLLAWGVLTLGTVIAALRMFDLVPSNGFTSYALQISSALEMLLLSFAIANHIQIERKLREAAQNELINSKQVLVDSLRASEERLERTVAVRTNDMREMLANEKKLRQQYIRFGSLISHEFRNPLGIIETQLALLKRGGGKEGVEKRISIIASATQRLATLFDNWLQGDRLESNFINVEYNLIDLHPWLVDIVESSNIYHQSHNIKLIPKESESLLVRADKKMLQVAILNLIDNACKYSPVDSLILVNTQKLNGHIGISIVDHGIGIASSYHQSIFDDYQQVNPINRSGGIGLGLAFVKRIVEIHKGKIDLISEINHGSTFTIWLPEATLEN